MQRLSLRWPSLKSMRKSPQPVPMVILPNPSPVKESKHQVGDVTVSVNEGKKMEVSPQRPMTGESLNGDGKAGLLRATVLAQAVGPLRNAKVFPVTAPWYIVNPLGKWRGYWDVVVLLGLAYTAIVTPFEVGFLSSKRTTANGLFIANRFIDAIFILDFALQLVMGKYDDTAGFWRTRLSSIFSHYVRHWFIVDGVSAIPFDLISFVDNSSAVRGAMVLRTVRLLRLMRLIRILKATRILRHWEHKLSLYYSVRSLIKFAVAAVLAAHWMACLFRVVVDLEHYTVAGSDFNWMIYYGLDPTDYYNTYITALYWATMTMTTVGYGDVSARTAGEKIVAVVCMMIGAASFAYVIGSICGLINSLDTEGINHRALMDSLQAFIKDNHLPKQLSDTLRAYFLQSRKLRRQKSYDPLLEYMSPHMKAQVLYNSYSYWLRDVPFFTLTWRGLHPKESRDVKAEYKAFVMSLTTTVKLVAYGPMEHVIRMNQPAKEMYVIRDGKVVRNGLVLGEGRYFGQEMLLTSYNHPLSVTTLTHMEGFVIRQQDLTDLLESGQFPRMRKRIRAWLCWFTVRYKFPLFMQKLKAEKRSGRFVDALEDGDLVQQVRWPRPVQIPNALSAAWEVEDDDSDDHNSDEHDDDVGNGADDNDPVQALMVGQSTQSTSAGSDHSPLMKHRRLSGTNAGSSKTTIITPRVIQVSPRFIDNQVVLQDPPLSMLPQSVSVPPRVNGLMTGSESMRSMHMPRGLATANTPRMSVQSWGQLAAKLEEICTRLTAIEAVTMSNNNIVNNPSSNSSSGVTVGTTEQSSPRA